MFISEKRSAGMETPKVEETSHFLDSSSSSPSPSPSNQIFFGYQDSNMEETSLNLSLMLLDNTENNSDENVASELQLQEAIFSSFIALGNPLNVCSSSSKPVSKEIGESSSKGEAESSDSQTLIQCEICAETKNGNEMFPLECSHSFCKDCISKHVSIRIKKQGTFLMKELKGMIPCPGDECSSMIEIESCRQLLGGEVVSMWNDVLCESLISPSNKFYCPYENCSELLVRESGGGDEVIKESECPFCRRLFCAKCEVPWHSKVDCEEFQREKELQREKEDAVVHSLAKNNKWGRCSHCKFYVEKTEGCLHIICRCGFHFCYACGAPWTSNHGGCM